MDYNGSEDPGAMQWNSSGKNVRVLTGAKAMRGVAKFLCMRTWERFNLVLEKEEKRKNKSEKWQDKKRSLFDGRKMSGTWAKWLMKKPYQWDEPERL